MKPHRYLLFSIAAAVVLASAAFASALPIAEIAAFAAPILLAGSLAWAFEHRLKLATWDAAPSNDHPAACFTAPQTGAPEVTAFA